MGNIFSTRDKNPGTTLKLEAQKITPFLGVQDQFPMWKSRTECAFEGVGYEKVLTDRAFALTHPKMNKIVYSQLTVATVDGAAYHLVLNHDDTKDGNGAWNALLDWFEGDVISSETADSYRNKLTNLKLISPTTASDYINKFVQYTHNLSRIPGEGFSTSAELQLFVRNIVDENYLHTAQWLRNSSGITIQDAITALRKAERDLRDRQKTKPVYLNVSRRIHPEENSDAVYKGPIPISEKGFLKLPKEDFRQLSPEGRDFIIAYNSKKKHGEDISNLEIPTGLHIQTSRRVRRLLDQSVGSPETPKKRPGLETPDQSPGASPYNKRIKFGLETDRGGDEVVDHE